MTKDWEFFFSWIEEFMVFITATPFRLFMSAVVLFALITVFYVWWIS